MATVVFVVCVTRDVCSDTEQQFHQQREDGDTTVQLVDRTGLHDVGHRLSVTAYTQLG